MRRVCNVGVIALLKLLVNDDIEMELLNLEGVLVHFAKIGPGLLLSTSNMYLNYIICCLTQIASGCCQMGQSVKVLSVTYLGLVSA